MRLAVKLDHIVRPERVPLSHLAVHLGEHHGRHTIRQPELTVVRRGVNPRRHRIDPADAGLMQRINGAGH